MRILYLIGNGFDINLKMKTSYLDFYKYYETVYTESDVLKKLKKRISSNIDNWSDLEIALGDYTKSINSAEEFDEIYDDLEDRLAEYLLKEEEKFDFSKTEDEILLNDLVNPEKYLQQADNIKIARLRKNSSNSQNIIDLITFNYTKTIENILGDNQSNIMLGSVNGKETKFMGVKHIHGFIDKRMVMGVNDKSQISNTEFHTNLDILETLVKNDCNRIIKDNIDITCKNLISNAELICIFGCSIGDSDKLWWELIGEQIKKQASLIIFEKGEKIPTRRMHKIGRRERKIREYFLSKTNLENAEKEKLKNKIFIGINTKIFNVIKKQNPVANKV